MSAYFTFRGLALMMAMMSGISAEDVTARVIACNNVGSTPCNTCPCSDENQSRVNNLSGIFIHDAWFYRTGEMVNGCQSCGGASTPPQVGLPSLSLARYYRSRATSLSGSLGVDHFLSTDTYLLFTWNNSDGTNVSARYTDPGELTTRLQFEEQVAPDAADDGILHTKAGIFRDLRLYDARQELTASAPLATIAVITDVDGGTRTFDLINLDNGPTRYGRLVRITNRVGVAVQTIDYRFAADAPLADLDGDRNKLWQVATVSAADLTQAAYVYDTVKRGGRFPVSSILLPNGSTTTFHYSGDVLISQDLPGRGTATFARSYDTNLQKIKTIIDDPAAEPGHQKKTVWWSGTSYILPHATVVAQTEGQVFRIDNAAGETTYMAWNDASPTVEFAANKYVWASEKGLQLFEVTAGAAQILVYARAPHFILGQDPGAADFSERTIYMNDTEHELVLSEQDSLGHTTSYMYDVETRRVTSRTNAGGSTQVTTYNERAAPLMVTDELGRVTTNTYDTLGNQLSKTTGTGSEVATWQWIYDSRGLVIAEIDANGKRTDQLYDARGRLIRVTEPADTTGGVRYARDLTYDAASHLIMTADQANRQTTYTYDAANRLVRRSYSDGSTEELLYGSGATAGVLVAITDRNAVLTTYAYDVAGRRIETRLAEGRPEVSVDTVTYAPGSPTRLSTRLFNGDATTMGYDPQGRLVAETHFPNLTHTLTSQRAYDHGERNFAQSDAYGRWTYRAYDQMNRVVRSVQELVPSAVGNPDQVRAAAVAASPAVAFTASDIGSPALAGSSVVVGTVPGMGTATLQGAGTPPVDQLQYFSSALASDATLTVRLDSQTQPDRWSKAGIMLRTSMDADAIFVGVFASQDGISVQYRTEVRGFISWPGALATSQHAPVWLRAQHSGTMVALSTSDDGVSWTLVGKFSFQRRVGARIGLSVTSAVAGQLSTAVFSQLSLNVGALDPAQVTVVTNAYLASLSRDLSINPGYVIEDTAYDGSGMMIAHTDGLGRYSVVAYDSQARVSAMAAAAGTADVATTTWTYDAQGNLTQVTNPRGFVTTTTYTGRNLMAEQTEATGTANAATTAYVYSPTHKVQTMTDALGRMTVYTYGVCCDRLQTIIDAAGFVTTMEYDFVGNQTARTDGNHFTTLMRYDGRNRQVSLTNGAGETMTRTYQDDASSVPEAAGLGLGAGADGVAISTTNPLQERSLEIRDGLGRTVRQVDALGHQTTLAYDTLVTDAAVTLVAKTTTDPLTHSSTIYQDGAGRARVSLDAVQFRSTMGFDAAGNRVTWRDANGVGMDCVFDVRNREVLCTDTAGAVTRKAYDANSNLVATTDALSQVETTQFDARDRKIVTTDRVAATTLFTYDAVSNLTSITDAEGGVTRYRFDVRNLLDREVFPQGQSARTVRYYTYDGGRRLISRAIAGIPLVGAPPDTAPLLNERTTYAYDAANRLTVRGYPDHRDDFFTYDTASRLTGANSTRYANQVARVYDAAGRLTTETLAFTTPSEAAELPVAYAYDNANRVIQLTYPDGSQIQRAYTDRDELQQVWDGGATVITRGYDAGGRLGITQYGNGLKEFRTYVPHDNLVASIATTGDVTNFSYTYDADKRKTEEHDWQVGGNSQRFSYDAQSRVTGWNRGNGAADAHGEIDAWQLSPVGDWTIFTRALGTGPASTENRTHDSVHELLAINAVPLTYDIKGNLTHDNQSQDFTWDFENRLSTAEHLAQGQGDSATYSYDALGRRVKKTVTTATVTGATYFVNAGAQEVVAITGDITAFNDPAADPEDAGAASYSSVTGEGARGSLLADPAAQRFNFQPASSDTPDGWLSDPGMVQSTPIDRGWTSPRIPVDRAHLGRPLYDTFIPVEAAIWRFPVANGTHAVVIMCGDADSRAQTNNLVVNGVALVDPTPYDGLVTLGYETGSFDGYALTVNVSDGFITIQAGVGALDPKINFIEVAPVDTANNAATAALVQDAAVKATHDTAKPKAKTPPRMKRNVWGTYVDELLTSTLQPPRHATLRFFAHSNHLSSIAALTDTSGAMVERYRYDAYGMRSILDTTGNPQTGPAAMMGAFTGRSIDEEAGFMYFRARQYSPTLGRFISRDPQTSSSMLPAPVDGYQDGLSTYHAYFIPGALDPLGLGVCADNAPKGCSFTGATVSAVTRIIVCNYTCCTAPVNRSLTFTF